MPVPWLVAVTAAPVTAEPDLSITVPEKLPVACPHALEAKHIASAIIKQARSSFFILFSLRLHTHFRKPRNPSKDGAAHENNCWQECRAGGSQNTRGAPVETLPCTIHVLYEMHLFHERDCY